MVDHPSSGRTGDAALPGADPVAVGAWLAGQFGEPAWREATMSLVGAGRSNLTYRVVSAAGSVVLRRPPVGRVAATAHDMGRERTVQVALAATPVPVPRVLAWSDGGPPVDAPCYVMELVDGVVPLAGRLGGWAPEPADRARAGDAFVDVLVALHALDPDAVGLGGFGRPEGFMARQLRRWGAQWESASADGRGALGDDVDKELTRLSQRLSAALPVTQRHTIVHGDFRIDNCVFDHDDPARVLALLDWELSALGDPLADIGLALVYWYQDDDPRVWRQAQHLPVPTRLPGFPSRADVAARYAAGSGLDLEPLPWYVAFGTFKLAVVLAGILSRVRAGSVPASMAEGIADGVEPLVTLGHHVLDHGTL